MGLRLSLIALALTLAACGEQADPAASGSPAETPIPVEPDGGIGDGAGPPDAAMTAGEIPVRFLGVWDAKTGTCDPASDLRLDIAEGTITFYESVGTVQGVREEDGATLVTLAMEGEGERWTQTLGLRLVDAGTGLMVIDPDRPGNAEATLRGRCPA